MSIWKIKLPPFGGRQEDFDNFTWMFVSTELLIVKHNFFKSCEKIIKD